MEPQVTQFNGKVYVMVPDHVEDIVVLRNAKSYQFTVPKDERLAFNRCVTNTDELQKFKN